MKIITMPKPMFDIMPLPSYYIDRPRISDFIIYKVFTTLHPWGVDFIFVKPKICDYKFKNFCLCVQEVEWVLKTNVHIGGWWLLVVLDEL
jgi:hypothetical protein